MLKSNHVCTLLLEQSQRLKDLLIQAGWEFDKVPYSLWRARKNKTSATAYESGKFVVQGKETPDFVQFILEPHILKEVSFGYELVKAKEANPEMFKPHAGIDESGKGDYFGPLVIASAFTDEKTSEDLFELGVQDSKAIKSEKKMNFLAREIKKTVKNNFTIVAIGPEAYNRMYQKLGNVNRILAWGHARVLENLLLKKPNCTRAISDQFGNKSTVIKSLMEKGKKIVFEQRHRAEADIAVAAASILARAEFVERLKKLEEKAERKLPKGAAAAVIKSAASLIGSIGKDELRHYAKLHFRTTEKALEISEKNCK